MKFPFLLVTTFLYTNGAQSNEVSLYFTPSPESQTTPQSSQISLENEYYNKSQEHNLLFAPIPLKPPINLELLLNNSRSKNHRIQG